MTAEQAKDAIEIYKRIPLVFVEVDLRQAVELAAQFDIYAYDAYVIVCAMNQNCPLLSLDAGLIRAAKTAGIDVMEVLSDADLS